MPSLVLISSPTESRPLSNGEDLKIWSSKSKSNEINIGHWTHVAPSGGGENQIQLILSRESNSDSRLETRYDTVSDVVESKVQFVSKILQHLRLRHTWISN